MTDLMTTEVDDVSEVERLHGEITEAFKTSLPKAIRIGEILAEKKSRLNHGEWIPWVRANLPFDKRTATNYMRLHRERGRLKRESVSHLGDAYKLLSEPKSETLSLLPEILIDGVNVLPGDGFGLEFRCGHDSLFVLPIGPHRKYFATTLVTLQPDGSYDANGDARGINVSAIGRIIEKTIPRYFLHGERVEFEYEPKSYNPWLHDSEDDKWAWQINRQRNENARASVQI